jgi:hypothetical protein
MMDQLLQILRELGAPLLIAVVTSVVTVHLSSRRFRAEKWWERKTEAYTALFDALHVVQRDLQDTVDRIEHQRPFAEGRDAEEADRTLRLAREKIAAAANMAPFLFSKKAAGILQQFEDRWWQVEREARAEGADLGFVITGQLEVVQECLKDLPCVAQEDVGIRAHR